MAPLHPHSPGFLQPGSRRKSPNYGAKLYASHRHGAGETKERGRGRARLVQAFSVAACPNSPRPRLRSPSQQLPRPQPRHTRAPSPVTRVSPIGLPGAARTQDAALTSLPPASPSAHRGRAPQRDPGAPRQSFRPHPAVLFPPGAPLGSVTRKVLSPPACPRAPQTPMPLAGNWQETPRCGRG